MLAREYQRLMNEIGHMSTHVLHEAFALPANELPSTNYAKVSDEKSWIADFTFKRSTDIALSDMNEVTTPRTPNSTGNDIVRS